MADDDSTSTPDVPPAPHGYSRTGRPRSHPLTGRPTGRPRKHALRLMRTNLRALTTRRLDGRSAVAVAVRNLKAQITADLGGDLTRAQQLILEDVAQSWIIRQALDDFIVRQEGLTTKKRGVIPVIGDRMRVAEHLAKQLERLGLKRVPAPVEDFRSYARRVDDAKAAPATQEAAADVQSTTVDP